MRLRPIVFWLHLCVGALCGLVIGFLCLTGTLLAFEKEIVAWAERDARRVALPAADTPRLTLDELQERLQRAHPDAKPATIIVHRDPGAAIAFAAGRSGTFYLNPYTGDVRQPASTAAQRSLTTVVEWHRYLGRAGDARPGGKLVTGVATIAFAVLAVTGMYLWIPRAWVWRAVRPVLWFRRNATSRARDYNWHHVIGFWCGPVLLVIALTALPISFRWAGEFLYTITGTELPASGPQSSGAPPPAASVPAPPPNATRAALATFFDAAARRLPEWKTITVRLPANAAVAPLSVVVREDGSWPRTANTTLQFDPFTGALLRSDGHADLSAARRLRAWSRFLHTGEALGWPGQVLAGLATLGGAVLVATGLALALRRFVGRDNAASSDDHS